MLFKALSFSECFFFQVFDESVFLQVGALIKLIQRGNFLQLLWLSCRASVLLLEGCWFHSLGLHVKASLDKILNPQTAPWQPPPAVYECMYGLL